MFLNSSDDTNLINYFHQYIMTTILNKINISNTLLNNYTALSQAILKGHVTYKNHHFNGSFNDATIQELKSIGAVKTSDGYFLASNRLPVYLDKIIQEKNKNIEKEKEKILSILATLSLTFLFQEEQVKFYLKQFFYKIQVPYKDIDTLTEDCLQHIKQDLQTSINNITNYILKQEVKNEYQLKLLIIRQLDYYLKLKLATSTNTFLFKIQKKKALDEGCKDFYWFQIQRPTKRKEHHVYYLKSLRGIKFPFNRPPAIPGIEPHCLCRAVPTLQEFRKLVAVNF